MRGILAVFILGLLFQEVAANKTDNVSSNADNPPDTKSYDEFPPLGTCEANAERKMLQILKTRKEKTKAAEENRLQIQKAETAAAEQKILQTQKVKAAPERKIQKEREAGAEDFAGNFGLTESRRKAILEILHREMQESEARRSAPSNSGKHWQIELNDLKRDLGHLNDSYTFGLSPDAILRRKLDLLTQIERIENARSMKPRRKANEEEAAEPLETQIKRRQATRDRRDAARAKARVLRLQKAKESADRRERRDRGMQLCPACDDHPQGKEECPTCGGNGEVPVDLPVSVSNDDCDLDDLDAITLESGMSTLRRRLTMSASEILAARTHREVYREIHQLRDHIEESTQGIDTKYN